MVSSLSPKMYTLSLLGVFIYIGLLHNNRLTGAAAAATAAGASSISKPDSVMIETEARLYENLLKNYSRHVRPSHSKPVLVDMQLSPHRIDLDEHAMSFKIHGYLTKTWVDSRLTWKQSDYNNQGSVRVHVQDIWHPDIVLYNFFEQTIPSTTNDGALVLHTGSVFYMHRLIETAVCVPDMAKFPFDTQTCTLIYGSMVYNGLEVNISTHFPSLAMADFVENNKWELVSADAEVNIKMYTCCVEPYPSYRVTFVLRRMSAYFSHVLVFPALLIGALVPFLFLLPPDSKERISLGIALLLACLLQIYVINEILPRHHAKIPVIIIYHVLTLVSISLSLVLSIFILNIYNRGPRRRKMPEIVRQIFLRSLRRLVCLGGDAYYPLNEQETVSMRGLDRAADTEVIVRPQDNQVVPKTERDMDEIKKHVRSMALRGAVLDARQEIFAEWQQVALVIDRILCIFFLLTYLISTTCLFA
ncbi:neuronal acetylcholine receptor subunit alpha-5-like [Argonauta hians]